MLSAAAVVWQQHQAERLARSQAIKDALAGGRKLPPPHGHAAGRDPPGAAVPPVLPTIGGLRPFTYGQ
jgi:hypothetical protein